MASNSGARRHRAAEDDAGEPMAQRRRLDDDEYPCEGEIEHFDAIDKFTHMTAREVESMGTTHGVHECLYCRISTDRENLLVDVLDESGARTQPPFFRFFIAMLYSRVQVGASLQTMITDISDHVLEVLPAEKQAELLERNIHFSKDVLREHLLHHSSMTYFKELSVCHSSYIMMNHLTGQLITRSNNMDASSIRNYKEFHKIYSTSVERLDEIRPECLKSLHLLLQQ